MRLCDIRSVPESYKPICPECNRRLTPKDSISDAEARALTRGKRPTYVAHAGKCPQRVKAHGRA